MSDYLKPGTSETDADINETNSYEEWFDNDPEGKVNAVFEEAMLIQAETRPTELAVMYVLANFSYAKPNDQVWNTWLGMYEYWSNNLDEQSQQQLEIHYQEWLGRQ